MAILKLILTLAVAFVFACLFRRLKVPGGIMVGAILGAASLSILSGRAYMPTEAKLTAQCLAGAFIGCSVSRKDLQTMPKLIKPALVLILGVFVLNMLLGYLIYLCSPMDLLTCLMCAIPGGMSDTPIIAADLGADAAKVALLQFVRMAAGIGLFPGLIMMLTKGEEQQKPKIAPSAKKKEQADPIRFPITLLTAVGCGILGKLSGIPAGALVFSMLGVIALKLLFEKAYLPMWAKRLAQLLSGAYIGCGIGYDDLQQLKYLMLPAGIILLGYLINSLILGSVLSRRFGLPLRTAMLAATPAGASDMALISAEMGINSQELVELQIIRMIVVVSLFPQIIYFIAKYFG